MPEGCRPFFSRLPDAGVVCLHRIVVLCLSLLFAASAQGQLTLNRYIGSGATIPFDPLNGGSLFSTNNWSNNGFTNISGVSVNLNLSSAEGQDFLVNVSEAYLTFNQLGTNAVSQATIYTTNGANPGDPTATSLNATFAVTNAFNSPGGTNEWILSLYNGDDSEGQLGEGVLNYWRLLVTGGAVTNGTISVGQQGIISGSDGYSVTAVIDAGSGTGSNAVTAFVTNSQSLNFNGALTGSGDLAKTGAGTLSVAGNSSGFSGAFLLNEGTANLTATNALGTGVLIQSNGSSTAIFSAGGTYTQNMSLYNVSFTNGGNTLSGTITNNNTTYTVSAGATNTLSGVLTGSGGVTKEGDGGLVIAGSANNTYTGATVVNDGALVLSNSSGNAINSSSSITVNTGGTLVLGASNQIGDSVGLILNGGSFLIGGANVTENLGTLTLSASSTIDFGNFGATGFRQLIFDDSSAINWTGTLTITNWQGVANTSSDFTEIVFGVGGLTSTQLGQIYFANQGLTGGGLLSGTGELVPVPEPQVYAAALALIAFVGWRERKRIASIVGLKRGR
jgi:autotransporter-associated beta strand protein